MPKALYIVFIVGMLVLAVTVAFVVVLFYIVRVVIAAVLFAPDINIEFAVIVATPVPPLLTGSVPVVPSVIVTAGISVASNALKVGAPFAVGAAST